LYTNKDEGNGKAVVDLNGSEDATVPFPGFIKFNSNQSLDTAAVYSSSLPSPGPMLIGSIPI
jgi:hypothetical protein